MWFRQKPKPPTLSPADQLLALPLRNAKADIISAATSAHGNVDAAPAAARKAEAAAKSAALPSPVFDILARTLIVETHRLPS